MCLSSRQTATLQKRRGKRSNQATPQGHQPLKPVQNPFWEHGAQLKFTGFAKQHQLEKGVNCQVALFLGVTLRDAWQAARCKSMGHKAGKTNIMCPLFPACFPSFTLAWAGGQRTGDRAAAGTDHDKVLTTGTGSFLDAVLLPHGPSTPKNLGNSPQLLHQEAATKNSEHGNDFSQSFCTLPTAFSRKKINPSFKIQRKYVSNSYQVYSVSETCVLKRQRIWIKLVLQYWNLLDHLTDLQIHLVKKHEFIQ